MLVRIGRFCFRHRRAVTSVWIFVFLAALVGGSSIAGEYANFGRLPGTDSQAAYDLLKRDFPAQNGGEGRIVFADVRGHRAQIDAYLRRVAKVDEVTQVAPLQVSPGGAVAVAPITIESESGAHPKATADRIKAIAVPLEADGTRVAFSGDW